MSERRRVGRIPIELCERPTAAWRLAVSLPSAAVSIMGYRIDHGVSENSPARALAWRCKGCRRILFRHEVPLRVVVALQGKIELKRGCNFVNVLGE